MNWTEPLGGAGGATLTLFQQVNLKGQGVPQLYISHQISRGYDIS